MVLQSHTSRAMVDNRGSPLSEGGRTHLETPKPAVRPPRPPLSTVPSQWGVGSSPLRSPPLPDGRRSVQFLVPLDTSNTTPYLTRLSRPPVEVEPLRVPMIIPDLPDVRVEQPLTDEQRRLHVEPALWYANKDHEQCSTTLDA